jgi:tetratricopeptide (TPR) repeat protein
LLLAEVASQAIAASEPASAFSPARRIWEQGQEAMRLGHPDKAIACYQQSLALDPQFSQAHLSLAAAYLDVGDDAGACPHLGRYVAARPDQVTVRCHYAELLYRLQRIREAREQFKRFMADAQEQGEPAVRTLLHCQSRLMEIAEKEDDAYAEHLHRGIGLLLLARARAELCDDSKDLTQESLLCKAAGELTLARQERPDEARPCLYLYEVWSALAQSRLAARWLRDAHDAAPFSYLTPAERCRLRLAMFHPPVESTRH